jgi:acetoin utilization deacetylase AcuC-like enzyme
VRERLLWRRGEEKKGTQLFVLMSPCISLLLSYLLFYNMHIYIRRRRNGNIIYVATGAYGAAGQGAGRGFALNLPLEAGLRDELFLEAFDALAGRAVAVYKPDCVILQW